MKNHYTLSLYYIFSLFLIESVFANPHLDISANHHLNSHSMIRNHTQSLPLSRTFNDVSKRKHNLSSKVNLHPAVADSLSTEIPHALDNFQIYYPKEPMKQENKVDEEQRIPLILGSIGNSVYSDSHPSLELFPGSLSDLVGQATNYISEVFSGMNKSLHQFFDRIDENLKKSNGSHVMEIGDVLF
ncbi:uncharacterized protein TA14765 [Theileria annulata]|uniref:Uncharacterized protein n=1 Tax=Theileria annulata TaxID=5874 RepID=Q4UF78_THEAN|nr:uncharacterized protein TA14765 [Theileria annulata]CAI74261.1 hypothetical protein TA14765 [Theileria annulata]|eukprot:XP_951993.1 hypothetical protein TA14765 [Theileria annulata]